MKQPKRRISRKISVMILNNTMSKVTADMIGRIRSLLSSVKRGLKSLVRMIAFLLVLVAVMLLGAVGLSSCAPNVRLTAWTIPVSDTLKTCPGAKLNPINDDADIIDILNAAQDHSLREVVATSDCRLKNQILNELIANHNARVAALDEPWYRRLF